MHPFPRPMSLRGAQGSQRRNHGKVCLEPLPLAAVVLTRFSEGALWEPETLSSGGCVLEMLANTIQAQTAPQLALHCLGAAATHCVGWKGRRGDAGATAAAILGRLQGCSFCTSNPWPVRDSRPPRKTVQQCRNWPVPCTESATFPSFFTCWPVCCRL